MSIPLYFAANCKESVTLPGAQALSIGCGLTKNGDFRQSKNFWGGTPLLIDDAITAVPTENCLSQIKKLAAMGCILDFERTFSNFHRIFVGKLLQIKSIPIWIPEAYISLAPQCIAILSHNLPHNSWRQFCAGIEARYPHRWALELQPLHCEKKLQKRQNSKEFFLKEALCQCRITDDKVLYYDTQQTLLKKLHIAQEYGCQGAIALWSEWPKE